MAMGFGFQMKLHDGSIPRCSVYAAHVKILISEAVLLAISEERSAVQ